MPMFIAKCIKTMIGGYNICAENKHEALDVYKSLIERNGDFDFTRKPDYEFICCYEKQDEEINND